MALSILAPRPILTYTKLKPPARQTSRKGKSCYSNGISGLVVQCELASKAEDRTPVRRSANYKPCIWDYDYVQSLKSDYVCEAYAKGLEVLKRHVKMMLMRKGEKPVEQLELIDILQRLGVSYHFEDDIKRILGSRYEQYGRNDCRQNEDLYATALEFRLLRQHGRFVPQDTFERFKDEKGSFKACLREDIKGILSLYEASHLSVESESVLEEARAFTRKHLQKSIEQSNIDQNLEILISHSLELPLHWRMLRQEARWFIDVYERRHDMDPTLLEFAKLDYNVVQAIHQEDLKEVSKWWRNIGLGEMMSFARDRLAENFLWAVGHAFEPQFRNCRKIISKVMALLVTIDDIYDVHGTMDELEQFTDVVNRWDINAMDQLPDYMKICFLALYNSINEMAYEVLKDQGSNITPYLKRMWADLCNCYLIEARWYHSGYTPTLEEYLSNGWISSAAPVIIGHAFFSVANPIEEAIECLEKSPNLTRESAMVLRLTDDLGTSEDELKRGDVAKSIQCYMHQTGASEEEAREHIKYLIGESWKKMNMERLADSHISHNFIEIAMNVGRMGQSAFLYGDGYGVQDHETKDEILSTLIEPVLLPWDTIASDFRM